MPAGVEAQVRMGDSKIYHCEDTGQSDSGEAPTCGDRGPLGVRPSTTSFASGSFYLSTDSATSRAAEFSTLLEEALRHEREALAATLQVMHEKMLEDLSSAVIAGAVDPAHTVCTRRLSEERAASVARVSRASGMNRVSRHTRHKSMICDNESQELVGKVVSVLDNFALSGSASPHSYVGDNVRRMSEDQAKRQVASVIQDAVDLQTPPEAKNVPDREPESENGEGADEQVTQSSCLSPVEAEADLRSPSANVMSNHRAVVTVKHIGGTLKRMLTGVGEDKRMTKRQVVLEGITESPVDGKDVHRRMWGNIQSWADWEDFVMSKKFELIAGTAILLNTFFIALHRQHQGFANARLVGMDDGWGPGERWPGVDKVCEVMEMIFGVICLFEVVAKLSVMRCHYFTKAWNVFDFVIITFWAAEWAENALSDFLNPMMLRMMRLVRLVRLMRVVRWVRFFDPLTLMIKSMQQSVSILVWSLVLLLLIMTVLALVWCQLLEPSILSSELTEEQRRELYIYWGNFSRALVSMFEITLANWGPPTWILINNVSEWWGLLVVGYKCTFGFCVVQVITSVFIQQTFKLAGWDEEVMIKEKENATAAYLKSLDLLFEALDESGDGIITEEEFEAVLADDRLKAWFSAMDVEVSTLSNLFHLLDDGDGEIQREEFIESIKRLRGPAKATDMLALRRETRRLGKDIATIKYRMKAPVKASRHTEVEHDYADVEYAPSLRRTTVMHAERSNQAAAAVERSNCRNAGGAVPENPAAGEESSSSAGYPPDEVTKPDETCDGITV